MVGIDILFRDNDTAPKSIENAHPHLLFSIPKSSFGEHDFGRPISERLFKALSMASRQNRVLTYLKSDLKSQRNLLNRKPEPRFPLALGNELGNLKVESVSVGSSYWLGKKFYYYQTAEGKEAMRIKGMPQKTIAEDGTSIQLVDRALYEDVYAGQTVTKECATLTKHFYGKEVKIQAHRTQRTVRPMCMYESYS